MTKDACEAGSLVYLESEVFTEKITGRKEGKQGIKIRTLLTPLYAYTHSSMYTYCARSQNSPGKPTAVVIIDIQLFVHYAA